MTETRLLDLRESKNMKQKDIAMILNIPAHTYGNYELGIRTVPFDVLIKLAHYYNTSLIIFYK